MEPHAQNWNAACAPTIHPSFIPFVQGILNIEEHENSFITKLTLIKKDRCSQVNVKFQVSGISGLNKFLSRNFLVRLFVSRIPDTRSVCLLKTIKLGLIV